MTLERACLYAVFSIVGVSALVGVCLGAAAVRLARG